MQLLSVHLFQEVMKLVAANGKKPLKRCVKKSLLPLFFNCHDENGRVAEVRTPGRWRCGRGLDCLPALASHGLQPPPGLGTGTWVLYPGLRCHLWVSAALQASQETLLCALRFLKRRDLEHLVKTDQMWRFGECLVRTACKPQPQLQPPAPGA